MVRLRTYKSERMRIGRPELYGTRAHSSGGWQVMRDGIALADE